MGTMASVVRVRVAPGVGMERRVEPAIVPPVDGTGVTGVPGLPTIGPARSPHGQVGRAGHGGGGQRRRLVVAHVLGGCLVHRAHRPLGCRRRCTGKLAADSPLEPPHLAHGVATDEPGEGLFIVFADYSSGTETYGGGRFLSADPPDEDGRVWLDFNKAYNPPCAFTPYATCPRPPEGNTLDVMVEAGEKNWGEH